MKPITIILVLVLLLLLSSAAAINYKEEYCRGQTYVGNGGKDYSYPHLHCGSDFFKLSKKHHGEHIDLKDASTRRRVLANREREYGTANKPEDITSVLRRSLY